MNALHAGNLALRFLLEVASLIALAWWGWRTGATTASRIALTVSAPAAAAALWGAFAAPKAAFPVTGAARYAVQGLVFGAAVLALALTGPRSMALALGALIVANALLLRASAP